ncbi:MAG: bifunctional phosphopantothenoylcysteine decarboxylase/phosphopantothenate--cysteine ligase CoaBC [Ignavibacterium album]|uniref:bifunctional phosphopantothenoylcysteine decarboxylase/phosphopantothenate--cysteine ligase CoaBC n=1 Tax=Ignavibacterium album TaxID=591197 RepID=UPI0026F04818|nr:bifunctional phosphopantothenoylcysteine decarboxylase/phosphopantothenate--cysteine ligase CoaBC [Ignavibacterium album]MBI5662334.1 bifunctional phosphopantothenoylcysteine decarboxylase/phosphopantothenate--cysteine ligase CoaBC [Ignavibacterium album]
MSKYKILFQITGSIAAYKSAYLISKLVQNDFDVQTIATSSALKFIGQATLEGLTSKPVLTDQFQTGHMMAHINLIKWADIIVLAPASANTINKMANGIADNLITSLFLAYDFDKPYLIAPAMNTNMFRHPATQSSIMKLKSWGLQILPVQSGYLACGDYGSGKMLEPDMIFEHIIASINNVKTDRGKKVLITSGATREKIDEVRFISNISTGKTASTIANHLIKQGASVIFLHSQGSILPEFNCELIEFVSYAELKKKLFNLIESEDFDFVIHCAAVSDYFVDKIEYENSFMNSGENLKIPSKLGSLKLHLAPTEKLSDKIKNLSRNKKVRLVSFKYSGSENPEDSLSEANDLLVKSDSDFVVLNHIKDRDNNIQNNFLIIDKKQKSILASTAEELAKQITKIIFEGL